MFQDIVTSRLILRDLRATDAEVMISYRSDPEVSRYQSWQPSSAHELRSFFEELAGRDPDAPRGWYQVGITLRSGGELIGDCGLHIPGDHRLAEIGITVAPPFQFRGYAAEALRAILGYLFADLGKHRVAASVDPRNVASIRLLRKLGFRQEGHMIESVWFKGEWADDIIFAMLAREWTSQQRQ